VLGGVYVRSDDRDGVSGTIAAGMATVLAAGVTVPSGGLRMSTVAEWSRQLLLREQEQGMPAGVVPYDWGPELGDPTVLAIGILADGGEPAPSAALLSDARVWEGLLGRSWGDGGAALREVIALAGSESGPVGDHVVRTGLAVVGGGLSEGDPSGWTVNRHTVAAVAPALGAAVTGHLSVATYALGSIADGEVGERNGDILRGLGYLTVDREAATAITGALHRWASAQPVDLQGTGPLSPLPVVAVPSAFLAVRQYGQRLAYALHGFEQQEAAESREWWWNLVIGLPVSFIPGPLGVGVGVGEGYAAILFGADGTWDNGADRGPVFDREDAAEAAADGPAAADATTADAVARQARATYDRAIRALGLPEPPESPETDYLAPLVDGLIDHMGDRLGRTPRAPR
jgi:hypothetical protein